MKIVLPVAGRGYRYEPLSEWLPKCLIPVRQKPLISWAVDSLNYNWHELVIIANERERHIIDPALDAIFDRKVIRVWTSDTGGAPHTVLKAAEHIDNREPLLIVTPDLLWKADIGHFIACDADAGLVVADVTNEPMEMQRKYSYCETDESGRVTKVVEKPEAPTGFANVGAYWWRHGYEFVRCAREYISNGETVRGEQYIAPIYNTAIKIGAHVLTVQADEYVNLGSAARSAAFEGWGRKEVSA